VVGIDDDFKRRPGVKMPVRENLKTVKIMTIIIVSPKSRYG
jgi:hypothetical protein